MEGEALNCGATHHVLSRVHGLEANEGDLHGQQGADDVKRAECDVQPGYRNKARVSSANREPGEGAWLPAT